MNCKAGDLAYVTHPSVAGKLVMVLQEPPPGLFVLPDGTPAIGKTHEGDWLIESMGAPFDVVRFYGPAKCAWAVCNDKWLRPIRGDGLTDEAPTDAVKPQPVTA